MDIKELCGHFTALVGQVTGRIAEGLKHAPRRAWEVLKKPSTRKAIFQILLALTILTFAIFAVLWLIRTVVVMVVDFINYYSIYICGIGCIIGLIYKWREDKKREEEERKRRELAKLYKQAQSKYGYLRNFLYLILTPHFCHLTGLAQPLTANNLTENPPFEPDVDSGAMFFFFKVDKENVEPLIKGTSHVMNLLLSVLSQKMETTGIEGICSATSDPLCNVITIHAVEDLGSHVRITLVYDNEAYQRFKEKSGVQGPTAMDLVEHIR